MSETDVVRRPRGRPPRVSRDDIITAARRFDPTTLTMQAIAGELGVDRKTLHYWVDNRASLLRMVAAEAFADAVKAHEFAASSDWREALRSFAAITRDAIVAAGAWASYVGFETEADLVAVRPAEAAVVALVDSGLTEMDAGDVVRLVSGIASVSAAATGAQNGSGVAGESSVHSVAGEGQYALIRRLLGRRGGFRSNRQQFDFDVQLVIVGVSGLIEAANRQD